MVITAALVMGIVAGAQSLGDIAKKEEERRKTAPKSGRIITNADLKSGALSASLDMTKIDPKDRPRLAAAASFLSYYYLNTRTFVAFCRERWDVDTSSVVLPYAAVYKQEFTRAQAIFHSFGLSEEAYWSNAEGSARTMVEERASNAGIEPQEACASARADPMSFVTDMNFATAAPAEHQLLMAARP